MFWVLSEYWFPDIFLVTLSVYLIDTKIFWAKIYTEFMIDFVTGASFIGKGSNIRQEQTVPNS